MANPAQVQRKHFRFPAYDDETGVKLNSGQKRVLFQNEPTFIHSNNVNPAQNQNFNENPYRNNTTTVPSQAAPQAVVKEEENSYHTQQQMEELAKHRSNLPDYSTNRNKIISKKPKTNLFGNMHKQSREAFGHSSPGQTRDGRGKQTTRTRTFTKEDQSYFVPTYVPASVIPEERPEEKISEQELVYAMKKQPDSYLILDSEPAAFQEKQSEDDPTVQKFNVPKDAPEIPLTRRQYQQIKPDMEKFGAADFDGLPRSRKELKSAKEQAKNQTAYGKKVSEAEQADKKGILDKSLSGLIEDSTMEMDNSHYFN